VGVVVVDLFWGGGGGGFFWGGGGGGLLWGGGGGRFFEGGGGGCLTTIGGRNEGSYGLGELGVVADSSEVVVVVVSLQ